MGTRHLTCVFHEGRFRVAQYGEWEGFPVGAGHKILDFLRVFDRDAFLRRLDTTRYITTDELRACYLACGATAGTPFSVSVSQQFERRFPSLDRTMGAEILAYLLMIPGEILLKDAIAFAADSLLCEWAYVLDFDTNRLEVYHGGNTEALPPDARFAWLDTPAHCQDNYHPVRLVWFWPLDDPPDLVDFLNALEVQP
jgi:hypothetical protein